MKEKPFIDIRKCRGCGLCVSVCQQHGLFIKNGKVAYVASVECDWCCQCELVCPNDAIGCPFEIVSENGE